MDLSLPSNINTLDLCMAGLILLVAARGALRGLMPEISGLVAFALGLLAAGNNHIHAEVVKGLGSMLDDPSWAHMLAYVVVFACTFIIGGVLLKIVEKILETRTPNVVDRILGGLAGAAKGVMLCTLILVCLHYMAPNSQIRRGSALAPYINEIWQAIDKATDGFHKFPNLAMSFNLK